MAYLMKMHQKFLIDIWSSLKLDSNPYTSLPSILFLVCTAIVVYFQFHRHTNAFTRWSAKIWRDIMFHWVYFYLTRLWFVVIKFARYIIGILDEYIESNSPKDEIYINKTLTHACVFMLTLTLSILPLMVLSIQQMYRRDIPNFLMWVAEDPWLRSEIGPSGHYLQRPPMRATPPSSNTQQIKNSAYRSKRSTSVDNTNIYDSREPEDNFRCCKSMMTVNVVKSIHELIE